MNTKRINGLDQIRGIGVVLMIIFHFSYDLTLNDLPVISSSSKLFWYWLPRLIVFIFLFCVGASLRIAHKKGLKKRPFLIRLLKISTAALAISIVTYLLYPERWVYFGTLHCIALCSAAGAPFARSPRISLLLSILIIAPVVLVDFKYPWLYLGHPSMDYEPFLPWFYASLLGIFVESTGIINKVIIPRILGGKVLVFLGKKALIIYLIHQPILFSISWSLARLIK